MLLVLTNWARDLLLVLIQIKHNCSILSIRRLRIDLRLPLLQHSFIADLAWVVFNENAFSVILHFRIIWTRFDPTRIADNATVNHATHRLEFRLRPPKSPVKATIDVQAIVVWASVCLLPKKWSFRRSENIICLVKPRLNHNYHDFSSNTIL